ARCLPELGQAGEESRMLDDWLQSNAQDAQVLGERGTLAMDEDKYTEAVGFLSRAALLAPFDRRIMHNLVLSLEHVGNKDEAQKYKKRLKAIDDDIKTLG